MNIMIIKKPVPKVFVNGGQLYANSLDVAAFFGKKHKHVLDSVEAIRQGLSAEISAQWFVPTFYETTVGFGTKQCPAFDMTRDGFALLVMGYTGPKALGFKVSYIEQFNAMEAELKKPISKFEIPQTLADALRLAADQSEQIEQQKAQLAISLPKAGALDRIATTDGTHRLMDAAKLLQVSPRVFFKQLKKLGWIYQRTPHGPYRAYQSKVNEGYMVHKIVEVQTSAIRPIYTHQARITQKGLSWWSTYIESTGPELFV